MATVLPFTFYRAALHPCAELCRWCMLGMVAAQPKCHDDGWIKEEVFSSYAGSPSQPERRHSASGDVLADSSWMNTPSLLNFLITEDYATIDSWSFVRRSLHTPHVRHKSILLHFLWYMLSLETWKGRTGCSIFVHQSPHLHRKQVCFLFSY